MNLHNQQDLVMALLDADRPIQPIKSIADQSIDIRLNIHRNHIAASRVATLRQVFPVLNQLLGEEYFAAMAHTFAQLHPPRTAVLHEYGGDLAGFVAAFPPLSAWPYLSDVARIEWARLRAFHSADAIEAAPSMDATFSFADLRLQPSVQWLCSDFPVHRIWLSHSEPALSVLAAEADWRPESVLIWRQDLTLRTEAIGPHEMRWLRQAARHGDVTDSAWADAAPNEEAIACLVKLLSWQVLRIQSRAAPTSSRADRS